MTSTDKELSLQEMLASNETQTTTSQTTQSQHTDAANAHATTAEHKSDKFEFNQLFDHLANHHGFTFGPFHVDMPMMFYDAETGFQAYSSPTSMQEAGLYTMHHGHPVKSSNHQAATLDLSITSLVCYQWIAIIILLTVFKLVGNRYKKNPNKAPHGIQNMIESIFIFVREELVKPNLSNMRNSDILLPYFIALFFFILVINLIGLIPGAHTATGSIAVTAGLAITAFFVINITAIKEAGIGHYLKHLLGGAPWWMFFIMIPIEILSMFIKPFALTIRLFANMTAGHVVLLSLVGLIFFFQSLAVAPITVGFSIFIYALETLVAFLQAYIFTMLTAIFVGLAIGEHAHHQEKHA